MELRRCYDAATAEVEPPLAIVDMDALRANAANLVSRAAGKPIRVASKSVRCRAILEEVLAMDGFSGIMAFTLPEALWLARHQVSDDILVAYPTADRTALAALAADPHAAATVTVVVDSADHLDLIEKAAGDQRGDHPIRVCLELDAAYHALSGRVRVGARRSPVHAPEQAAALAREIGKRPGLVLAGIMAYESQIAGVGDDPPGRPLRARAIRAIQARSRAELAGRRAAVVRAVREVRPDLEFVNGGGTGSVEKTAAEEAAPRRTASWAWRGDLPRRRLPGLGQRRQDPPAAAVPAGRAVVRRGRGSRRGADSAAGERRRFARRGRPRLVSARQGR